MASTRSQAVDVPRDRNSCLPIVSLHVATSRPRDLVVAPLDADPGASSRMMIDPIQPCDVEMNAYEIPFPHLSLSSRDLHQDFLPSALPRVEGGQPSKISDEPPAAFQPGIHPFADPMHCDPILAQDEPIIEATIVNAPEVNTNTINHSLTKDDVSSLHELESVGINSTTLDDNIITHVNSPSYSSQIVASAKIGSLPHHLKFLQPSIPIPEGYTWVILHGGWTLIP